MIGASGMTLRLTLAVTSHPNPGSSCLLPTVPERTRLLECITSPQSLAMPNPCLSTLELLSDFNRLRIHNLERRASRLISSVIQNRAYPDLFVLYRTGASDALVPSL